MMRFLKSTLFPDILGTKKSKSSSSDLGLLKNRIKCLEEENEKAAEAIQEISKYLSQMTLIVSSLATELSVITTHIEGVAKDQEADEILKSYLASDDDGYIH